MEREHRPQTRWSSLKALMLRLGDALLSLQFRATALVVILTLAVTSGVAAFLLRSSSEFAREQHYAQIVQSAALLAKAAAPLMAQNRLDELMNLAAASANGSPLLYVIFSDASGNQIAAAEHRNSKVLQRLQRNVAERVPVPGTPIFQKPDEQDAVFLDVTYPISVRESSEDGARMRLLGYARTGMMANAWHRTMAQKLDLVIGVGLLATVAAIPLGFLLVRRIIAPIEGLSEAMLRFSQGKLETRSPLCRRDEIGRLARAFNQMADQHQLTHERIIRLNAELEERVAQRTQQLRELASREPLTGLYNRRHFNETLQRRFAEAQRYGSDLSCIMIDLDNFKKANDAHGHQVGDEIIVTAARTLVSQLRSADVAARYGGDEFVVLLPQTDAERARVLAERVVERFTREMQMRFSGVDVSMSVGIASLHSEGVSDADSLVRVADHGLYDAKAAGKNKIVVAGEPETTTV